MKYPTMISPCPITWEELTGSGKTRHCGLCKKQVHNLSALTAAERANLLGGANKNLCVAYLRTEQPSFGTTRALMAAAAAGSLLLTAACATRPQPTQLTQQESRQEEEIQLSPFVVGGI